MKTHLPEQTLPRVRINVILQIYARLQGWAWQGGDSATCGCRGVNSATDADSCNLELSSRLPREGLGARAVPAMWLDNVYIDTAHYLMYVYPGVMEKIFFANAQSILGI